MQTATTYGTTSVINACTITVAAVFPLLAVLSLCPTIQTSWVGAVVIEITAFKCVSPIPPEMQGRYASSADMTVCRVVS